MRSFSFFYLALVGFGLSLLGVLSNSALNLLFHSADAFQLSVSLVGLIYVLLLVSKSQSKTGRVVAVAGYSIVSLCLLAILIPHSWFLIGHLVSLFLFRAIFFQQNFITCALDIALTFSGGLVAYWVQLITQSWLLTLWSFFLIQSLLAFLPRPVGENQPLADNSDQQAFRAAFRVAEHAAKQLSQSSIN